MTSQVRDAITRPGSWINRTLAWLSGSRGRALVSPLPWPDRVRRFLAALLVLGAAYQLYSLLVVPLIEPATGLGSGHVAPQDLPTTDTDSGLAHLFPDDAWERQKPMMLMTRWGRLLFRQYSTSADGRLELTPCTIVFQLPGTDDDDARASRPIILQTPDRAVLSFSGPMNLLRAEVGKLEGARLEGEVKITSPESRPGADDAIHIVTRNIQILPQQIWTPHDVVFRYGPHHGSGRELSITLTQDPVVDKSGGNDSLVRNLETLELAHIDRLVLQVPQGGLLGGISPPSRSDLDREPDRGASPDPAVPAAVEVEITCQGPFRFDFQRAVASLEDHVDIARIDAGGQGDRLVCDQLSVHFTIPKKIGSNADTGDARRRDSRSGTSALAVGRVEAQGMPATLRAPTFEVTAQAQRLAYDFDTRQIVLQDEKEAFLSYRTHQTRALKLQYELPEDPRRLGRLWAAGPGVFQSSLSDGAEQALRVTWSGMLEIQPQDQLHVMSIVQGADITWDAMGQFTADELYLWLEETPRDSMQDTKLDDPLAETTGPIILPPHAPGTDSLSGDAGPAPRPSPKPPSTVTIRPVKMLAKGNVRAASPRFQGQTRQLEVWFDPPRVQSEPPNSSSGAPRFGTELNLTPSSREPADRRSPTASQEDVLEISGGQIRLRVLSTPARYQLREATVLGQVRVAQKQFQTNETKLAVTGETLQLHTDELERTAVDVSGAPARVDVQGVLLESSRLHVSQRENRIWADGHGRMKLPALRPGQDRVLPTGPPPSSAAPVWVAWQRGMDFDGQLVRFVGQVEVRGVHTSQALDRSHLVAVGDQLQVLLSRYVDFQAARQAADPDVAELRFLGDVLVDNQTFNVRDEIVSHDRMTTRDMVLDRRTGDFRAVGPGWITSTRIDQGGPERFGGTTTVTTPGGTAAAGSPRLVYLRIDYENQIRGNVDMRQVFFEHFVRTVYGPVPTWDGTLDPDRRGGLGPQGIVMTCSQLAVAETGEAQQRGLELSAQGNTLVEGNAFTAKAHRLAYTQVKNQLVFEGDGRGFAQLRQQRRIGERPTEFTWQKFMYWVDTGQVEVFDARQLDYTHIGSPESPPARIR